MAGQYIILSRRVPRRKPAENQDEKGHVESVQKILQGIDALAQVSLAFGKIRNI